jgi:oligosaccharide repeat unit polymerase
MLIASSVVALAADLLLLRHGGGLRGYFTGLSNRSSFLSGSSFLTLAYLPLLICLVYFLLYRHTQDSYRRSRLLVGSSVAILTVSTLLAGGRAQIVLGLFVPLLLVKQLSRKPFRWWQIAALTGVSVIIALVMGLLLRDNQFDNGASYQQLKSNPAAALGQRITSGIEMRPFDSLVRLNQGLADGEVTHQEGITYTTVPGWFVPRALWSSKPFGGGNTWFTSNLLPRFYWPYRVETSLSAPGEAYANFGYWGLLFVGGLTGLLAAVVDRIRRRKTVPALTLAVTVSPLFGSFIRGDAYHNVPLVVTTVTACAFASLIARSVAVEDRATEFRPERVSAMRAD